MDFFFGSDGFSYFVWTSETGYFDVNYVINASAVLDENSRVQNGGHYNDSLEPFIRGKISCVLHRTRLK